MKRLVPLIFLCGFSFFIQAQNVGIGTTSPNSRLHIIGNTTNPLRVDGFPQMYMGIYESGIYRGYWGSYSGNAEDVDIGTGTTNSTGKMHLTIRGIPALTVDANNMVGIGTTVPAEMLSIQNGNIRLNNSPKGIILDGSTIRSSPVHLIILPVAQKQAWGDGGCLWKPADLHWAYLMLRAKP